MQLQTGVMSYGGNSTAVNLPPASAKAKGKQPTTAAKCSCKCEQEKAAEDDSGCACEEIDFTKMTPAQKMAWHKSNWDRILG